jgi:anti-sigma factor RsiW
MNCSAVRKLLEDYFEGTLADRRRAMIASHLEQCDQCAAELQQIEKVAAALAGIPRAEPAVQLVPAISTRLADLSGPDQRRTLVQGWARLGALSAVCVAALTGVRYLLPSVWALLVPRLAPVVSWLAGRMGEVKAWGMAGVDVAVALLAAAGRIAGALALAAESAVPTLGTYAICEITIILAIVLILQWRRGRRYAGLTLLV